MQVNSVFMKLAEKYAFKWTAPTKGHIHGTKLHGGHPVIVISDNSYNEEELSVYVVPLTSEKHSQHCGLRLAQSDGVAKTCYAKIDQMQHLPKKELGEYLGQIVPQTLSMLEDHVRTIFFGEPKQRLPRRKK
jgi:mRNA-degrading endonuclease toxin of MazEF toxin-antitoxin module